MLVLLLLVGGGVGFYAYKRAQSESAANYSPTQTSYSAPPVSAVDSGNRNARAGQAVVNDFQTLKDGHYVTYRIPSGHYRIRVTANNNGIKARWVGVSCYASPKEEKIYEATCDPAAEVQFIVENPSRFGMGDSEQATISVVTK